MDRLYITAQELLEDSFRLAHQILASGFLPNHIVGIWRGGTPVGIAVQEFLDYRGVTTDHIAIRTSAYTGLDKRASKIRVHGLDYLVDTLNAEDRLLIVDDVFDTGLSIDAVLRELQEKCRRNLPGTIRIATVYYKHKQRRTGRKPDFYIHETDAWLVFPHELRGLTLDEIKAHKSAVIADLLQRT